MPDSTEQAIQNRIWRAPSVYTNLGSASRAAIKTQAAHVMSFTCFNDNTARRFLQLHNTSSAPQDDDVPVDNFLLPGDSQIVIGTDYFGQFGKLFSAGVSFVFSTTTLTATSAAAADCILNVHYT